MNGGCDAPVEIDCGLDFFVLVSNEGTLLVAIGVVIGQDAESLGVPALANEPTGGFGAQPEDELEDGGDSLNGGWNPPRPRGIDLGSPEGTPSDGDRTRVPEGVVEDGQRSAVRRVGQLGDQHGGASVCEGETENR